MSRQKTVDQYFKRPMKAADLFPLRKLQNCDSNISTPAKIRDEDEKVEEFKPLPMVIEKKEALNKRKTGTLDGYLCKDIPKVQDPQWFKKDMSCSVLEIEEQNRKRSKPNSESSYFLSEWLHSKNHHITSNIGKTWAGAPKEIMALILGFLGLADSAKISRTCRHWWKSYRLIWQNHSFFRTIDFAKYQAQELQKIFEKGRLRPIVIFKNLFRGKKLQAVQRKAQISVSFSEQACLDGLNHKRTCEELVVKPIKSFDFYFNHADMLNLVESSEYSLRKLELLSCTSLSEAVFLGLAKCRWLQFLSLNQSNISDQCVEAITSRCLLLQTLSFYGCRQLTNKVFAIIAENARAVDNLDLGGIPTLKCDQMFRLAYLPKLAKLSMKNSGVTTDNLMRFSELAHLSILYLDLEGCSELNNQTLKALTSIPWRELSYINLDGIKNFQERYLYDFLKSVLNKTFVQYPNYLNSARITNLLDAGRGGDKILSQ